MSEQQKQPEEVLAPVTPQESAPKEAPQEPPAPTPAPTPAETPVPKEAEQPAPVQQVEAKGDPAPAPAPQAEKTVDNDLLTARIEVAALKAKIPPDRLEIITKLALAEGINAADGNIAAAADATVKKILEALPELAQASTQGTGGPGVHKRTPAETMSAFEKGLRG